jgi:hypothetical protein
MLYNITYKDLKDLKMTPTIENLIQAMAKEYGFTSKVRDTKKGKSVSFYGENKRKSITGSYILVGRTFVNRMTVPSGTLVLEYKSIEDIIESYDYMKSEA